MFSTTIVKPICPKDAARILLEQGMDRIVDEALRDPLLAKGIPPGMLAEAVLEAGAASMRNLDEVIPFRTRSDEGYLYETWEKFLDLTQQSRTLLRIKRLEH